MSERLSRLAPVVLSDPRAFARMDGSPLLVWERAPVQKKKTLVLGTLSSFKPEPSAEDPLCFRVRKFNRPGNAFTLGVTIGRAEFNDVPLDDGSVSRFHAYLQRDGSSGVWHVVDAESFNGTAVDGAWLQPSRPAPVRDQSVLKLGNVDLRFLLAESFGEWLKRRP